MTEPEPPWGMNPQAQPSSNRWSRATSVSELFFHAQGGQMNG
jgi:hypothetical protein